MTQGFVLCRQPAGADTTTTVRGEASSAHVRTFRWALTDADWITPSVVEAARESMSEAQFAAEYLGPFAPGADAVFTRQALVLRIRRPVVLS